MKGEALDRGESSQTLNLQNTAVSGDRYPNYINDSVKAFVIFLMLITPHAIFFVVPIRTRRRVHPSFASDRSIWCVRSFEGGSVLDDGTRDCKLVL